MNSAEEETYQEVLLRAGHHFGLNRSGNLEQAIIDHCLNELREWTAFHGKPETLSQLVNRYAVSLDVRFEEIWEPSDMDAVVGRMDTRERTTLTVLRNEFGDDTDAATVLRVNRQKWEPAYLALINCQGRHELRRYFSKWHELAHRLLEGSQLTFALRRTKVERQEPEEILVDKIAAALAFFPDMFVPVLEEECVNDGGLTFGAVERVRKRIVPDASREATMRAALRHTRQPAWLLKCSMRFTAEEQRKLDSPQLPLMPEVPPEAKLRIVASSRSPAAEGLDIRFHNNMRVPDASIVARAFSGDSGKVETGVEFLDFWETRSGGPIGTGAIKVQSSRTDSGEVWSLIHLFPHDAGV